MAARRAAWPAAVRGLFCRIAAPDRRDLARRRRPPFAQPRRHVLGPRVFGLLRSPLMSPWLISHIIVYSLLSQVLQRGPIRPGDLAKAMALDASTLTRNLKPLVAAGWLSVGAGADDRSHLVAITDAGREKRTEARRRWRVAQDTLNELLGVERVLALHELIDGSLRCFAERETRLAS